MFARATVKRVTRVAAALVLLFFALPLEAIDASDRYRSPRNPERRIRQSTRLIVLHTTEAPARSSLNKLSDRGEAHFCVTEAGQVYRIVDRDRVAFHAGRSMWNGIEDVDYYSIGIECVGYHNKPMPTVELAAIRQLVKELQSMYRLSDDKVVCHSHVAYGAPNKWQRRRHRGRKRCGMLFAMASVRRQLGLRSKPSSDPDTRAGRLAVGDDYLRNVLYCGVDTMARTYGAGSQVAAVPAPATPAAPSGSWISRWLSVKSSETPPPAPVPARAVAAPKPVLRTAAPKSIAQLKSGGWVLKGYVTQGKTAMKLAGARWSSGDTYYTIRDKVIPGSSLDEAKIEKGMGVWVRK